MLSLFAARDVLQQPVNHEICVLLSAWCLFRSQAMLLPAVRPGVAAVVWATLYSRCAHRRHRLPFAFGRLFVSVPVSELPSFGRESLILGVAAAGVSP